MNARLVVFASCFAAVSLVGSAVNAAPHGHGGHAKHGKQFSSVSPRGGHGKQGRHFSSISPRAGRGKHGKHFSSVSPRGGHKFSRRGSKFSYAKSGRYRNWTGGNWSGGYWGGGNWDSYPSKGWGIPYARNNGYYSYGYYPWYRYGFGYPFYCASYHYCS